MTKTKSNLEILKGVLKKLEGTDDLTKFILLGTDTKHQSMLMQSMKQYNIKILMPPKKHECLCSKTDIMENCYIVRKDKRYNLKHGDIHIIGNECMKRFLPKENRQKRCINCEEPHKNRKNSLCNSCRKKADNLDKERCRILNKMEKLDNFKVFGGKYKGMKFYEVYYKDPQYIRWLKSEKIENGSFGILIKYADYWGEIKKLCREAENIRKGKKDHMKKPIII